MVPWQRKLRLVLGVLLVVFAAIVYVALRRQPAPPSPKRAARPSDSKAETEIKSGTFFQYKGKNLDFTLQYGKVFEYAGGTKSLRDVHVTFTGRNGRAFDILGAEGTVSEDQSSFVIKGNVQMKASDGLVLHAQEASYAQTEGIVRVPGPVDFAKGRMHGSAVGLTYDDKREVMSLLQNVRVTAETENDAPAEIEAASAVWPRTEKNMRFDGGAKITRRGQTLTGDSALMYLTADEEHLQRLELHGHARIQGAPTTVAAASPAGRKPTAAAPAGGTLRDMQASDISLVYGADGETLQQAILVGGSSVEVIGSGGAGVTRVAGEFIDIGLDAAGTAVHTLLARAADARSPRAELTLPPQNGSPARVIRAVTIQGPVPGRKPDRSGQLTSLRFTDNVEYREMPAPPADPTRATSRTLDADVEPGLGTLNEARFSGSVTFNRGDSMQATSNDAVYSVKIGQLDLTGSDERGQPRVVEEQATIQALHIKVTPDTHVVWAQDGVQTNFKPNQKRADGTAVHTPSILAGDQPVYATSDHLDYDGTKSTAVFTSKVRSQLWQPGKGTAIHAATIQVDNSNGNLFAKGSVISTLPLEQVDDKTKRTQKVTSEGRAEQLAYDDATHRATYTTNTHIKGTEGDLTADRAVVHLNADGNTLERLDAFTNVTMVTEGTADTGRRTTTGDKLVYTASDERYVVTGRTVQYRDECHETQGKSLTFFRSVGRIIVDGNEERRTQTKGGQGCKKEPHFD